MNTPNDNAARRWFERTDEEGRHFVAAHLPCATCGYDIWGVSTEGRCPECATAISASLDAAVLGWRESDRLVLGAIGCAAGSLLCIAFALAEIGSQLFLEALGFLLGAAWLFIVGWLVAAHYVATAPPFVLRTPGGARIAMISRAMTILAVAGTILVLGGIAAVLAVRAFY